MLEKQIQSDMVAAMKAKETVRLAALRGIKGKYCWQRLPRAVPVKSQMPT